MALLSQYFIMMCVFVLVVHGEKRLLLSDPNVINDRLLQMEKEIQKLTAELMSNKQETTTKMADITTKIFKLEQSSSNGAIYTRWGRRTCPTNGTEIVYEGFAGGGRYDNSGSAAEHVCLPHDQNLITNAVSTNPYGFTTHIYGAEYEDNVFGSNVLQYDVPCAVCHSTHRSSVLIIPGRNHCINGWKFEYNGKLAPGAESHKSASQFVCVDSNPEVFERSGTNKDGKLFYPVRASCGSLPCPPYINNAFLTCVVCSK